MRILVAGGAGFIGGHLCERLIHEGHHVICVDSELTGQSENLSALGGLEQFQWLKLDITSPFEIEGEIDQIYHLACPASPVDYKNLAIETLLASSHGTKNLLDLAVEKRARFIFTSTSEIYGDPLEHPQVEAYWGNVNCIGERSCYDEGKRYAESLIVHYGRKYGLDARIVRVFNTYGPRMRKNDGRVIPNFIVQALEGDSITIYGDGKQTRSFCYVDDMVEGLMGFMNVESLEGPVNWGNPEEVTIGELAEAISELVGSKSELIYKPLPQDDPTRRCPNIEKGIAILEKRPQISLREGLQKTIDFFEATQ